jgi:hypothetical protein
MWRHVSCLVKTNRTIPLLVWHVSLSSQPRGSFSSGPRGEVRASDAALRLDRDSFSAGTANRTLRCATTGRGQGERPSFTTCHIASLCVVVWTAVFSPADREGKTAVLSSTPASILTFLVCHRVREPDIHVQHTTNKEASSVVTWNTWTNP